MTHTRQLLLTLVAFAPLACATDNGSPQTGEEAPSRVGPVQDLGSLFEDARLSFHADGDGFRAAHTTHQAVVRGGAIAMTPYHWDGERTLTGAPVEFATASLSRGGADLGAAAGGARVNDLGVLEIARGGATELLQNREDGLEQSWRFAAAPAGEGDLVVAVAVSGHQTVTTTASGLHFMTPGRLGLRYSNATWIDATGTSWNLPVSWDGQQALIRVPGSVLDRSTYPAVLDPTIGAERAVDRVVSGFVGARAREPAIAWSGTRSLVVWRDDRSEQLNDIYAARVGANGDVLDVRGILVSASLIGESEPTVTWIGNQWLLAWTRSDDVGSAIAAATVSPLGEVSNLGVVVGTSAAELAPALASTGAGAQALLVWQHNNNIRAALFAGGVFGAPFYVASTSAIEANPAAAASPGGNYLVTYEAGAEGEQDIRARLVNEAGVNGTTFVVSATVGAQTTPAVAFNGTDYMLAWRDRGDIWGARVSTAGVVLDQTGDVGGVVISANDTNQARPSVACDPGSCLVAWEDRRDTTDPDNTTFGIYGQRVGFNGSPAAEEIAISDPLRTQNQVALAPRSSGFTAVWEDQRTGVSAIFSTPIGPGGAVEEPTGVLVNRGRNNRENRPSYAVGGSSQLAVWSDSRVFGDSIMARRYDENGVRLDDGARAVSVAPYDQTEPSVDWDGSQYLVVWHDARNPNHDIFAARVQEDGTLTDPEGIEVSAAARNQLFPDVASGGGVSLAVWQDRRDPASGDDLMGAIIAADGSVLADIPICQEADDQQRPAVAWDPGSSVFVVVWADRRGADLEDQADVYAARVEPDGDVLDPGGVLVSGAASDQWMVDIATSGDQLLVVWEDFRTGGLEPDVFGARLDTSGGAIDVIDTDGIAIATGASGQNTPAVVGVSGGRFGLAWTDDSNELTTGIDINGNTMQADGTLEPEYVISNLEDNETGPSFQNGVNTGDRGYLVYQKGVIASGLTRVVRRVITY